MAASASDSQFNLYNFNDGAWETSIECNGSGNVELYYDNDLKLFTRSAGAEVTTTGAVANFIVRGKEGYGACLTLASDDGDDPGDYARIYQHTDEALYFQVYNAANNAYEDAIVAKHDGAVELYYDNAKVFYTTAAGAVVKRPSGGETQFQITGCEGNAAELRLVSDDGDDNDDFYKLTAKTNHDFAIENFRNGSSWETNLTCTGDGAVDLYHNGTKKFYTEANGATVMGNLAMGSAGDGINFGADSHATGATSELLDDYEEGTFSVSFWASNTNFNTHPTLTTNQGRYTKIGNKVSINGRVVWSNNAGGAAGNIYMDGLPFSQSSNTVYAGVHFGWWHLDAAALDSDEVLGGYINNNTSYIIFVGNHADASAGSTTISVDELMNGKSGDIQFNCTYFTDS